MRVLDYEGGNFGLELVDADVELLCRRAAELGMTPEAYLSEGLSAALRAVTGMPEGLGHVEILDLIDR